MRCWACQALALAFAAAPHPRANRIPSCSSCPPHQLPCPRSNLLLLTSAPTCCAPHQALVSTHAQPLHLPLQIYLLFRARLAPPFTFAACEPESLEAALFRPEDIPWDSLAFSSVSIALKQ